jgi:hypothetical protein
MEPILLIGVDVQLVNITIHGEVIEHVLKLGKKIEDENGKLA